MPTTTPAPAPIKLFAGGLAPTPAHHRPRALWRVLSIEGAKVVLDDFITVARCVGGQRLPGRTPKVWSRCMFGLCKLRAWANSGSTLLRSARHTAQTDPMIRLRLWYKNLKSPRRKPSYVSAYNFL